MEDILSIMLFRSPSSFQILWMVGALLFLLLLVLIYRQYAQRKKLKWELAEIEKLLQTNVEYEFILKAMHLATWHLDPKMRAVTFDNDFRDKTDSYTPEAGTNIDFWTEHILPNDKTRILKALDEICQGNKDILYGQYQMKSAIPGKTYWEESYATVGERDEDGNPLKIVGASMRIDERKELESALILARNKAEESDRLKTAFLANMSHEIRTPLNAIVGFADLLPTVQNEEDRRQLTMEIKNNTQKLLRIISGLVSMSKIEAGAHSLSIDSVDINVLLQNLKEQNQPNTDVPILLHLPQKQMMIHSDHRVITEMMDNLLQNAIKFTLEGSITLGYDIVGDELRLWVKDTGRGISEADQQRIFDRFVKLDQYIPGTGLGLSVVKTHASHLGGTVGVESTPGKGSFFWVLLPIS